MTTSSAQSFRGESASANPFQETRPATNGGGAKPRKKSLRVAVVGAGAAGLAAAKELLDEGHVVRVFEAGPGVGGVWRYEPEVESGDMLGQDAERARIHSSMYRGLRTNLPREVMSYLDFPFLPEVMGSYSVDDRRFCSHEEVYGYMRAYADHYDLHRVIICDTKVDSVRPVPGSSNRSGTGPKWDVTTSGVKGPCDPLTVQYDAVVVCNGHYSEPLVPPVTGIADWPRHQIHSHNYRSPDPYAGQKVLVVGASASGEDIAREVAEVASAVYLSARSWQNPAWGTDDTPIGARENVYRRNMVGELLPGGGVSFEGIEDVLEGVDSIVWCTGYKYHFPMLKGREVSTDNLYVAPLYKHMFTPALGASLSFVGLCWKIVPFPQFELQSRLVARLLSGRATLPPQAEMEAEAAAEEASFNETAQPARYLHCMGSGRQWAYNDWLAETAGPDVARMPAWRVAMNDLTGNNKRTHPETYRDVWLDEEVLVEAHAELATKTAAVQASRAAVAAAET